jgi:uncharacterized membrane protein
MTDSKQSADANVEVQLPRILNWIVAAVLGTYTELLTEILRKFGNDVKGPMMHWDLKAVFLISLFTAIIVVPIFLMSKASEKLADRKAQRIIFIIALLVSAYFLPPLSWFGKFASNH